MGLNQSNGLLTENIIEGVDKEGNVANGKIIEGRLTVYDPLKDEEINSFLYSRNIKNILELFKEEMADIITEPIGSDIKLDDIEEGKTARTFIMRVDIISNN